MDEWLDGRRDVAWTVIGVLVVVLLAVAIDKLSKKKVLDQNISVSTALPCRISIYDEGGKTILAALKPTTLLATFNAPQLEGVAQEVEATIVKIMKEAASG